MHPQAEGIQSRVVTEPQRDPGVKPLLAKTKFDSKEVFPMPATDYTPARPADFDYDAALAEIQERIRR